MLGIAQLRGGTSRRAATIKLVVTALLTIVVLWILLSSVTSADALMSTVRQGRWQFLPLEILMLLAVFVAATLRWGRILECAGYRLSFRRRISAILTVWPLALVIPSRANDFLRAIVIRDKVPVVLGVSTVLVERFIDIQALCTLALIGALASGHQKFAAIVLSFVFVEAIAIALIRKNISALKYKSTQSLIGKLYHFYSIFQRISDDKKCILVIFFFSCFLWTITNGIIYVFLTMFGASVDFLTVLAIWPLALFVGMLPVTVGGMGTRDAAFLLLLAGAGEAVDNSSVLAATLCYVVLSLWLPAFLGIPLLVGEGGRLLASTRQRGFLPTDAVDGDREERLQAETSPAAASVNVGRP